MLSHILLRNLHRRHRHMVDLMSPDPSRNHPRRIPIVRDFIQGVIRLARSPQVVLNLELNPVNHAKERRTMASKDRSPKNITGDKDGTTGAFL